MGLSGRFDRKMKAVELEIPAWSDRPARLQLERRRLRGTGGGRRATPHGSPGPFTAPLGSPRPLTVPQDRSRLLTAPQGRRPLTVPHSASRSLTAPHARGGDGPRGSCRPASVLHGDFRQREKKKSTKGEIGRIQLKHKGKSGSRCWGEQCWEPPGCGSGAERKERLRLPRCLTHFPPPPLGKCRQSLQHLSRQCQAAPGA